MTEHWTIDLVGRRGDYRGPFAHATGGSLEWSISRPIHGSGTIEVLDPPETIDWLDTRLRIAHHADGQRTRMGVWIPAWPEWEHDGPVRRASISLLDKLHVLSQPTGIRQQYGAGTAIIQRVTDLIMARGEDQIAITPSAKTTSAPMVWDPTDTWLTVINDLLEACGYGHLYCDMNGWFRAEPWIPPDERIEAAVYGGRPEDYRVLRRYKDAANVDDVPNVVYAYSKSDGKELGLRGEARLDDPASPLSTHRRGEIVKVYDNLEAADQAVINRHAQRLLTQAIDVTRRVTYTHPVDGIQLRDRVTLRRLGVTGVVANRRIRLGVGPVVEDTLRHIYTGGQLWT